MAGRMRILRVAQKLYPDVTGGGPYHVHAMSRDQAAMGHEVTVATVRADPTLPDWEEHEGYTVRRFDPTVSLLGNDISLGLARYLAGVGSDEFDVIHAHSHLYFATNLAALKRRFSGIPLAITNHGLYSQNAPEWLFRWYLRTLGQWTFNRADVVFCYTEVDKVRVREFGVESRIEVVPNGIDTERFTPEGPESELVDGEGPVVLFVGRLVEGKRPGDAIKIVEGLVDEHPSIQMCFCGEGPLQSDLENDTSRRGLSEHVDFLGHLPYDELPAIFRSSDVLVLTSRSEGVPRTVLEAMASETPVVVSDLPQISHVVTEGGKTVQIGAVEDFVQAIDQLLRDPEQRATSGSFGRESVVESYQWSDTVMETTSFLSDLAMND